MIDALKIAAVLLVVFLALVVLGGLTGANQSPAHGSYVVPGKMLTADGWKDLK
jgi:hypothetical protein